MDPQNQEDDIILRRVCVGVCVCPLCLTVPFKDLKKKEKRTIFCVQSRTQSLYVSTLMASYSFLSTWRTLYGLLPPSVCLHHFQLLIHLSVSAICVCVCVCMESLELSGVIDAALCCLTIFSWFFRFPLIVWNNSG